ncbi:diacylglycerol kinase [Sphingomonas populi]|uniref:Diacylglycerol kinase n=1 Tax=Sphingomonas populi TaxID=2484750 RepID=A0A4Q6Y633_9SPHN|nr:diacylglycerol kinase [Sphingomonas populi]
MRRVTIQDGTGRLTHAVSRSAGTDTLLARAIARIGNAALAPMKPQPESYGVLARAPATKVGIIFNRHAHRNIGQAQSLPDTTQAVDWTFPHTEQDLRKALARFADRGIDVLVVDGGDGTIRDVLSIAPAYFRRLPKLAIIPSGKTNALALDLGIPIDWSLHDALGAIAAGRTKQRSPIEVRHAAASAPHLRGFLFGAGAFVEATAIAQGVHGMGGFRGVAVGLSLAAAIAQTVFGKSNNRWRRGLKVGVALDDGMRIERNFYIILGSTLKRLPLGLRPFGRERAGLKVLGVDAPPRHVLATLPALLAGSESAWLERFGYHRCATDSVRLTFDADFVLDGETYPGGDLILARGGPLDFVVP